MKEKILTWTPVVTSILALCIAVAAFNNTRHRHMARFAEKHSQKYAQKNCGDCCKDKKPQHQPRHAPKQQKQNG